MSIHFSFSQNKHMKKQKKSAGGSVMNNTFLLFYSLKPLEPSMNFFIYGNWSVISYTLLTLGYLDK